MTCYFIEPRTRKFVQGYGFLSIARNLSKKYGKQLLDTATKTGLNAPQSVKNIVHRAAQTNSEFFTNENR